MSDVDASARSVLARHWRPAGYCVPNAEVYPAQWLWDSCFHAICWARLGDATRARRELRNVFARQGDDGFVPHITYWDDPDRHAAFWGRRGCSAVTQPPMYGHTIAVLDDLGVDVADDVVAAAARGLRWLAAARRRDGAALPMIVHPWESGCDDSPRWDSWASPAWSREVWYEAKGALVSSLRFDAGGSPVGSEAFEVESSAFAALVLFNAAELARARPGIDLDGLDDASLARTLRGRWSAADRTFEDLVHTGAPTSGRRRTLEALLPVLVADGVADATVVDEVFAQVRDDDAFGGRFGPAQVHRADPAFEPLGYWRGASWPQLTYLLWVAATRLGRDGDARWLAERLRAGARASGFAEYWHPDRGTGGGAAPQTWTALAAVVRPSRP